MGDVGNCLLALGEEVLICPAFINMILIPGLAHSLGEMELHLSCAGRSLDHGLLALGEEVVICPASLLLSPGLAHSCLTAETAVQAAMLGEVPCSLPPSVSSC